MQNGRPRVKELTSDVRMAEAIRLVRLSAWPITQLCNYPGRRAWRYSPGGSMVKF